jgi:hypothetical protein
MDSRMVGVGAERHTETEDNGERKNSGRESYKPQRL